jgi:hypothetical protein
MNWLESVFGSPRLGGCLFFFSSLAGGGGPKSFFFSSSGAGGCVKMLALTVPVSRAFLSWTRAERGGPAIARDGSVSRI